MKHALFIAALGFLALIVPYFFWAAVPLIVLDAAWCAARLLGLFKP
jgi:hypothetical protein